MLPGRATPEGTSRFEARFGGRVAPDHFSGGLGLRLSSIGLGTYLGDPTPADDRAYEESVRETVLSGGNVVDCAINYRFQRSERSVGAALAAIVASGEAARDEILVATKGGFVPFEGTWPADPAAWVAATFLDPGIVTPDEIVADCHCMAPAYIEHQIETSRRNLGLETIDLYYLHNPETQLQAVDPVAFLARLRAAFEVLERKVAEGRIAAYGLATWDGFRRPPGDAGHLDLAAIRECSKEAARAAGSGRPHFAAIQLPLNLAMPESLLHPTQKGPGGNLLPAIAAAAASGLTVMASASILQGHLVRRLPAELESRIPGGATKAQKAIQWVRSAPGLTTALVGMKNREHVRENFALAAVPRMSREAFHGFLTPRG